MTAYEVRISDWSSDVCSSDLGVRGVPAGEVGRRGRRRTRLRVGDRAARGGNHRFRDRTLGTPAVRLPRPRLQSHHRSEERREGKECVSTCSSRWPQYHKKKNKTRKKNNK